VRNADELVLQAERVHHLGRRRKERHDSAHGVAAD